MRKYILSAFKILSKVFVDGSYSNRALSDMKTDDMTTKLVYGVLERNVECEYILSTFIKKKPSDNAYILLKIGTYALRNLTNVPQFAIVSETVEVAKSIGKDVQAGFINAVLKRVARGEYSLPKPTDKNYLSVTYSIPEWFAKRLVKEYGREETEKMLSAEISTYESVRINGNVSRTEVLAKLDEKGIPRRDGAADTILVPADNKTVKDLFNDGRITFQSSSSILAVRALGLSDGGEILDLCSAPGGKAVLASEIAPNSKITACDLYEHRLELIKKYSARMRANNITTVVNDGTAFNPDFKGKFDFVLCDAPCSCFGTFRKHPDVFLQRGEKDIPKIAEIQKSILKNAVEYAKPNGIIVYSTCTLFHEENDDVVNEILKDGKCTTDTLPESVGGTAGAYSMKLLPTDGGDGFYIARLKRL